MPEETASMDNPASKENMKAVEGNGKKMKKSATSNGFGSFAKGKLVLARVNMLDGTVTDVSLEVSFNSTKGFQIWNIIYEYQFFVLTEKQ